MISPDPDQRKEKEREDKDKLLAPDTFDPRREPEDPERSRPREDDIPIEDPKRDREMGAPEVTPPMAATENEGAHDTDPDLDDVFERVREDVKERTKEKKKSFPGGPLPGGGVRGDKGGEKKPGKG